MLAVEMLPAGYGDALVVEYGSGSKVHRLLVDCGTIYSYGDVRARLLERRDNNYEAFVITHVDEDHIGGAVALLDDRDLRHRIDHVWFNGYVHSERGGNVLGPVDGEALTKRICDGGYKWNMYQEDKPFPKPVSTSVGGPIVVPSKGDLPSFPLKGGATIYLLSPSGPKLKRMAGIWDDVVTKAGLVPGQGADQGNQPPAPYVKDVKKLPEALSVSQLAALAKPTRLDSSPANGSSIAFILEYYGTRVLLGADAHSSTLVSSLRRFAKMMGEQRARIDLCKLPHHGSRANVTTALIEAIDSARYLVSTDGMKFGHPDDAALARVLRSSSSPAQIYCNYDSPRTSSWVKRAKAAGATIVLPKAGATSMRVEVS